jgi:hypothetical protein
MHVSARSAYQPSPRSGGGAAPFGKLNSPSFFKALPTSAELAEVEISIVSRCSDLGEVGQNSGDLRSTQTWRISGLSALPPKGGLGSLSSLPLHGASIWMRGLSTKATVNYTPLYKITVAPS